MLITALTAACFLAAYFSWSYSLKLKSVNYLPGMRPPLSAISAFGALIPTSWWNPGLHWSWEWRKTNYFNYKHDVISMVPLIGRPVYYTCSLPVMKQLLKEEGKLGHIKPTEMTDAVLVWGQNLLSANGDVWKRHRRIVAPAITNETYELISQQAAALYEDMVRAAKWENEQVVTVNNINQYIRRFALGIISRCGFGLQMPWTDPNTKNTEEEMSFPTAMEWVATTLVPWSLVLPRWSYRLPSKWLRNMEHARSSLAEYMNTFVETKVQEISGVTDGDDHAQRGDIFTRLVAGLDRSGKTGLEKQEVIGNTFALMFAGHETTSSVLSATLGYLAFHQDEQEKAYQEILAATPANGELGTEELAKLTHTLACFHESARMIPAAHVIPRDVIDDVAVNVTSPTPGTIVFPKGSRIIIDMVAIHHNPETFLDPEVWRPSRWYGVSEHDLTMFSTGPRVCPGRKFAQMEAVSFLAHLLRDWKIDIEPRNGETRKQLEERVMGNTKFIGLAFGVRPVGLKLIARK
ncbi:cytochrome P450 [Pisolithus orientalis]|uniref:cytochrome P450 n=1 Tax=Pisolithus orientalis TaxID=936130 RepID=UPI0022249FED|nr:cytochrome P450 [Pisolithus orientalis]KAI5998354.1 cytochrome P450 [Pisolithus orientalis]